MRSIELFSGCGGMALGLSRAGFHHELMAEWNEEAVATVLHNRFFGVPFVCDWPLQQVDVRKVDWRRYAGRLDLVAGGPPCQPFSVGGKHKGSADSRDMWPEAIRAVRETRPRAFLFENVRGLLRPSFAPYLRWIVAHLGCPHVQRSPDESPDEHRLRIETQGVPNDYQVRVFQVNAADFGAPQKRHRVIIAGVRADLNAQFAAPSATHSRERLLWDQWVTGEYWGRHDLSPPVDALVPAGDMPLVAKLRASREAPAHQAWITVRDALTGLGEPDGRRNHVRQEGARSYPGHTGSPLDQPAKALKAGDHGVPGGENMMIRDDGTVRYFTTREAARLQGLPDEYEFPRSWSESMRQLGNAVPCQLAEALGLWLVRSLSAIDQDNRAAA